MTAWTQAAGLVGCAILAGGVSALFHPSSPPWYEVEDSDSQRNRISVSQAHVLEEKGRVVWIDARTRAEYDAGHVSGAILLNVEEWADLMFAHQMDLQEAYGIPVIVYCSGGGCERSAEIAQRLRELIGLDPVYVLDGDWQELMEKRHPSEQRDEESRAES